MARGRKKKDRMNKKVPYKLIGPTSDVGKPIYAMLKQLVKNHHDDLLDARIALAWCESWKGDTDGHLKLGMCRKASDLDREFIEFDFIIVLNKQWWTYPGVEPKHHFALIDHELCHATVRLDKFMEPVVDERGRKCWRIRKHDIEEFGCIVKRHGLYKADLEKFASDLKAGGKEGVLNFGGKPPADKPAGREAAAVAH